MEENDGAPPGWSSPPTPKKVKIESEEPKELSKDNNHAEEESKGIEDDDEDGPPPGWQQHPPSLPHPPSPPHPPLLDMIVPPPSSPLPSTPPLPSSPRDLNMEQQESEDEGPPPGWDNKYQPNEQAEELVSPPPVSVIPSDISDIKTEDEKQDSRNEDGPEPRSQAHPSPTRELVPLDIKAEEQDSEDDGPPPGWDSKCLPEPELQTEHPTTTPSDLQLEDEQQDDEGPPPGWDSAPQRQSPAHPSLPSPMVLSGAKTENEQKNVKVEGERPQSPSRLQSIPPTKPQILAPKPPTAANNLEMGQMVCGSCRRLLSYPRGARYVECACCLEENYVLEEHEVGQVACGGCNVLLMYPYGAPKVRCVNCSMETEIGDRNRRPPLSEQQRRVRHHPKRVQTS